MEQTEFTELDIHHFMSLDGGLTCPCGHPFIDVTLAEVKPNVYHITCPYCGNLLTRNQQGGTL